MRRTIAALCGILLAAVSGRSQQLPDSLSLEAAISAMLENHAQVKALRSDIHAKEAAVEQASVLPNPEVEIEAIGSRGESIEGRIGQRFELGGKREARRALARHELEVEQATIATVKREVELELYEKYLDYAAVQEKLLLVDSLRVLAGEMLRQTVSRVESGAANPADTLRLLIESDQLALQRLALDRAAGRARMAFTALCGDSVARRIGTSYVNRTLLLPDFDSAVAAVDRRPDMADARRALGLFDLEAGLTRAERMPDLLAAAGVARNGVEKVNEPLLAVALDLPLWNKKNHAGEIVQGNRRAEELRFAYRLKIERAQLEELYETFRLYEVELELLTGTTVPRAEALVAALGDYYRRGSAGLLETIAAQSDLMRLKVDVLDLYAEKAQVALEIMRLSGLSLTIVK